MPDNNNQDVHDDPEFHALPLAEKHKVLLSLDPDYRGLPPSEQAKALDEIHYGPKPSAGTRNKLADTIQTQTEGGARKLLSNFGLPTSISDIPRWGQHFLGQDPGQKSSLSEMIESHEQAGKESKVGYVPIVGPLAVSASHGARSGRYGEMAADLASAVGMAAPGAEMAGRGLSAAGDVAGRALRSESGAIRPSVRLASEIGGLGAGYGVGAAAGHPYIGSAVGARYAPKLVDAMAPERPAPKITPFRETEDNPWVPLKDRIGAEAGTEGVGAEDIMRIPEPRGAPTTPNLINSIPREELPGLAQQGRQGAGEQLRATGKTVVYTPESGYAPPKSKQTLSEIMEDPKSHPRKGWHGGPVGDIKKGNFFLAHDRSLAEDYASDYKGNPVNEVEDRSQNPLVLDTPKKFTKAWKESGADKVKGQFHPDQTKAFGDWARNKGHDAIVIPKSAFKGEAGHREVGGRFGEPQTMILKPEAARVVKGSKE